MFSKRLALIPAAAAALAFGRWLWQGTGTVWSRTGQRFYLPDPDLGWRRAEEGYLWIGLDLVLAFGLLALGVLALSWATRRRPRLARGYHRSLVAVLLTSLLLPAYAAAKGHPGSEARLTVPAIDLSRELESIDASVAGLPAGSYQVIEHPDSAIAATLVAGGEAFEARFAGGLSGVLHGDPSDLRKQLEARISVRASSIATGIELRDEHAREELATDEYPTLDFELGRVLGSKRQGTSTLARVEGRVRLGSKTHDVEARLELRRIDEPLRHKLSLGPGSYLLVKAHLTLRLSDTFLVNDGTFDQDDIPIAITLILEHTKEKKR